MNFLPTPGQCFWGSLGVLAAGVLVLSGYLAWDAWPWRWVRRLRRKRGE